jgi:protocatechuate 3,4-dioxygenase beta subunit
MLAMNDDRQIGQLLSRREAVALLAGSGAAWMLGGGNLRAESNRVCVARPEQTEGPYFVDAVLNRSDIRLDPRTKKNKAGQVLALSFDVSRLTRSGCEPLPDARVDIWQCDAEGVYSDELLRGYQITDGEGAARFLTIYPGWYAGRTVHIHFKVRVNGAQRRAYEFTSQVYFDDAVTDAVAANAPYSGRTGRRVRNQNDWIYRDGGEQLKVNAVKSGSRLEATLALAMEL